MSFNSATKKRNAITGAWDKFIFNLTIINLYLLHYTTIFKIRLTLSIYYLNLFQRTPLHDAAEKGDVETLKNLGKDVDINIKDKAEVCKSVLLVHL